MTTRGAPVAMPGRTDSRTRQLVVLAAFVLLGAALLARLAWWQVVQHASLSSAAQRQSTIQVERATRRGTVYDRSGTVVLATTVTQYRVVAAPDQLTPEERRTVGPTLSAILSLDAAATAALQDHIDTDKAYVILGRGYNETVAERIRVAAAAGQLPGISLEAEQVRVYPQDGGAPGTSLAAHVLGFVNRGGQGQYGIEEHYQAELAGTPEVVVTERDAAGQPAADAATIVSPGAPGEDLRLTIDADLQLAVEQEILSAYTADSAQGVSAVVMNPATGEILAEASYPSYDASQYGAVATKDASRFIDPVISTPYEPGSVFKMLTALAGFEQGTITPNTKLLDSGSLSLDHGSSTIYDSDRTARGRQTVQYIVAYSRNVGAARIALGLGGTTAKASSILAEVWGRLGVGQKTGVDLAGESAGIVRNPAISPWREVDLANAAFGQGVAVTQLQLTTAYAAMVNGGRLVQPHVVAAIGDRDVPPLPTRQVISPERSAEMVKLMEYVVKTVPWYASKTLVHGYVIGGKTGTAQIWDPKLNSGHGGWKVNRFNNTFVGYIGKTGPELVIAVTIREPKPLHISQGNLPLAVESYELFRRIATDAMGTVDLTSPTTTALTGQ